MTTKPQSEKLTLTAKAAGAIIGMSQPTLRKWIREGVLRTVPSSPDSRRRKILRSELKRFEEMLRGRDEQG